MKYYYGHNYFCLAFRLLKKCVDWELPRTQGARCADGAIEVSALLQLITEKVYTRTP